MIRLNSRDRVLAALNHQETDRVPIDLGSTNSSSVNVVAYTHLVDFLKYTHKSPEVLLYPQVVIPSEFILKLFSVDTRPLRIGQNLNFGENQQEEIYKDEWGVIRGKPENSYYYDILVSPLAGQIEVKNIEKYPFPNPDDDNLYNGLRIKAKKLHEETNYSIVFSLYGSIILQTQYLRGFNDWFIDILANKKVFNAIQEKVFEVVYKVAENSLKEVAEYVDIVYITDDLASQEGLLFDPKLYRSMIKPKHRKIIDLIKSKSNAKVLMHACGSIVEVIPDFIDMGVDAINPLQLTAKGMDPTFLKRKFGKNISFWGGIDTHNILPHGSRKQVKSEVIEKIDILSKNGGYVIAPNHNIQADVPPENIIEMYKVASTYNK